MDEALRRQPLIAINFILSPTHLLQHERPTTDTQNTGAPEKQKARYK